MAGKSTSKGGRPPKSPEERQERLFVGLPGKSMTLLKHFAAYHGRGTSVAPNAVEEARELLEMALAEAMVDALDNDSDFVAEVLAARPEYDEAKLRAEAQAIYDMKRARAFGRQEPSLMEHTADALAKVSR